MQANEGSTRTMASAVGEDEELKLCCAVQYNRAKAKIFNEAEVACQYNELCMATRRGLR